MYFIIWNYKSWLNTYASIEESVSLYFLGYVPDFKVVLTSVASSASTDEEMEEIPLLELLSFLAAKLGERKGRKK